MGEIFVVFARTGGVAPTILISRYYTLVLNIMCFFDVRGVLHQVRKAVRVLAVFASPE